MNQGRISGEDQSERTALRDVKLQTKVLEHRVSTWDKQSDTDVEARPNKYRATNGELTELLAKVEGTQARTTAVKEVMRKFPKHLIKVMEMGDVKMNDPMDFKELKKRNTWCRFQAMGTQVKAAREKELASFTFHLCTI